MQGAFAIPSRTLSAHDTREREDPQHSYVGDAHSQGAQMGNACAGQMETQTCLTSIVIAS